jgi:hypothetical protein
MKNTLRKAITTVALGAILLAPLGAQAASAERDYQLNTRIVLQRPQAGEFDGTMQLRVTSDGIVTGFYRPDNGRFIAVTGGLSDKTFWLDIGSLGPDALHFTGTFVDGHIDAAAFSGDRDLKLIAQPKGS